MKNEEKFKKVLLTGKTQEAIKNPRYDLVFKVISYFEDQLDTKLDFQIPLNYSTLESLYKAMNPGYNLEEIIKRFYVLSPNNFFKLLYEINSQKYYTSSKIITDKYLMCESVLLQLNTFFNEYDDIFTKNITQNYSSLYLFDILYLNSKKTYIFKTLYTMAISDKNIKKRHFAASIINEFENVMNRYDISSNTKENLGYKVDKIAKNLDIIVSKLNLNETYTIDFLYANI